MKTANKSRTPATKHVKPSNNTVSRARPVALINGRLVGPTLADPELQEEVKKAAAALLPNREAALKYFVKRGILTPSGKLTKRSGGQGPGNVMNKPVEFQTILGTNGKPAFIVVPYADFVKRYKKDGGLIPHAVVVLVAAKDLTPAKAWRTHLKLTRGEVASRMGIKQSAYAQLEGSAKLRKSSREQIAGAMGIAANQLDF